MYLSWLDSTRTSYISYTPVAKKKKKTEKETNVKVYLILAARNHSPEITANASRRFGLLARCISYATDVAPALSWVLRSSWHGKAPVTKLHGHKDTRQQDRYAQRILFFD